MNEMPLGEPACLHAFKNQLSIVIGFADLLMADFPAGDFRRRDVEEIRKAGCAAVSLIPTLVKELQGR